MRRVVLLCVVLTVAFSPAPFPRTQRKPAAPANQMIGLWEGGSKLRITADRLQYHPDTPSTCDYHLKVDLSATPATYDIAGVEGSSTSGRTYVGIWRVEGDTLTIYYTSGNGPRPASFSSGGISETYNRVR